MKAGKVLVRSAGAAVLAASAAVVGFFLFRGEAATQGTGLASAGRFKVGSMLGEERAGFSGKPKLQVFADPDSPEWPQLKACLEDPPIQAELGIFTPILVDARDPVEAGVEARARQLGYQVVARALSGKFLGGLKQGFSCEELLGFLRRLGAGMSFRQGKSPIYHRLLETTQPIEILLQRGERPAAEKLAELLREFEGPESPAVQAVDQVLGE